jgi:hypothetical protein
MAAVRTLFHPGRPVKQKELLTRREQYVEELIMHLTVEDKDILIQGPSGVGKTSVALTAAEILATVELGGNPVYGYVQCKSFQEPHMVLADMMEECGYEAIQEALREMSLGATLSGQGAQLAGTDKYSYKTSSSAGLNPERVLAEFTKFLKRTPFRLLIFDELGRGKHSELLIDILADSIKEKSARGSGPHFVLVGDKRHAEMSSASHESNRFRNLHTCLLEPFTDEEMYEIIAFRNRIVYDSLRKERFPGLQLSNDAISVIVHLSCGYPAYAHELCLHMMTRFIDDTGEDMQALYEMNVDEVTVEEKYINEALAEMLKNQFTSDLRTIRDYHKGMLGRPKIERDIYRKFLGKLYAGDWVSLDLVASCDANVRNHTLLTAKKIIQKLRRLPVIENKKDSCRIADVRAIPVIKLVNRVVEYCLETGMID